jgi:hypothetical protein
MQKTRNDFVQHVVETMRDSRRGQREAHVRRLGPLPRGLFFALIAEDALYLKVDEENLAEFEAAGLEPFVYVTKDGDRMRCRTTRRRRGPREPGDDDRVGALRLRRGPPREEPQADAQAQVGRGRRPRRAAGAMKLRVSHPAAFTRNPRKTTRSPARRRS